VADVLLIRHARSVWNEEGRWQGHADPPLSERGEADARAAGRSVGPFDLAVSSDLSRARRTAELFAPGAPLLTSPLLRERDVGSWSGLTTAEIEAAGLPEPEGGESGAAFEARVGEAERWLAEQVEGCGATSVLVVAHGGVLRVLAGRASPLLGHLCGYRARLAGRRLAVGERVDFAGRANESAPPEAVRSGP
jgi:broad specificity phosphatase PhoE